MDTIKIIIEIEFPKEQVDFVAKNQLYQGDDLT